MCQVKKSRIVIQRDRRLFLALVVNVESSIVLALKEIRRAGAPLEIRTGCVDFILSYDDIALELMNINRHLDFRGTNPDS